MVGVHGVGDILVDGQRSRVRFMTLVFGFTTINGDWLTDEDLHGSLRTGTENLASGHDVVLG